MSAQNQNHPFLDNEIKINLPQDRHVIIQDSLSCKDGIYNNIRVKTSDQYIRVESRVDPNGSNDLKVYKNDVLVKHVVNGVTVGDHKNGLQNESNLKEDPKSDENEKNNSQKTNTLVPEEEGIKVEEKKMIKIKVKDK